MLEGLSEQAQQPHPLAPALVQARRSAQSIDATDWIGAIGSPEQAYAVQEQVAQLLGWFGSGAGAAHYWKSGGGSRQATLTHAGLDPAGVRSSPGNLHGVPLFSRAVEAEIALRLGQEVTAERAAALTAHDAVQLVDAMAVSIEIVDSRWREGADAPALLRLADAQSHGALVLGAWQRYEPRDWSAQTCQVAFNDGRVVRASGTHPLGDPAWLLLQWLGHCTRFGASVAAGSVVTTGSWVGMLPAQAGDAVQVEFPGVGAAEVRL